MIGMTNTRILRLSGTMPIEYLQTLDDIEQQHVADVSARSDTSTVIIVDLDTDKLAAYAVYGIDEGDMFVIYAAHCFMKGIAAVALKSFFGGAQILGKPLRVHTETVAGYARAMGAPNFFETVDGDGVNQGVFYGQ